MWPPTVRGCQHAVLGPSACRGISPPCWGNLQHAAVLGPPAANRISPPCNPQQRAALQALGGDLLSIKPTVIKVLTRGMGLAVRRPRHTSMFLGKVRFKKALITKFAPEACHSGAAVALVVNTGKPESAVGERWCRPQPRLAWRGKQIANSGNASGYVLPILGAHVVLIEEHSQVAWQSEGDARKKGPPPRGGQQLVFPTRRHRLGRPRPGQQRARVRAESEPPRAEVRMPPSGTGELANGSRRKAASCAQPLLPPYSSARRLLPLQLIMA